RWPARLVLLAFVLALAGCLAFAGTVGQRLKPDEQTGEGVAVEAKGRDLDYYRTVVEEGRKGRNYYDVAARLLPAYGFPTGSLFNWRPPTYAWLMRAMPTLFVGRALLVFLAALAVVLGFKAALAAGGPAEALALGPLLAAMFLWVFEPDVYLTGEMWA